MDIIKLFIDKNKITSNQIKYDIKKQFLNIQNIDHISRIIYRELYLPNNNEIFQNTKKLVNNYINILINTGELNKLLSIDYINSNDLNEHLTYVNFLFIQKYKFHFLKNINYVTHEINNNPYKQLYTYKIKKKNSDILSNDYESISFNNYNDIYLTDNKFNNKYHSIPYYEKSLYKINIDKNDNGSFRERKLINNNYKKYNNDELLNNIEYLK